LSIEGRVWLRTPEAVRVRCNEMLALAERERLRHFSLHLDRLDAVADYVAAVTRAAYPTLAVPYHSRWRHFVVGGVDRWKAVAQEAGLADPAELARARIDLCTVSVLLDAGAGPDWRFRDPVSGRDFARSEGLALASLETFRTGLFSGSGKPRADGDGLASLSKAALGAGFQVSRDNRLVGLAGRAALLQALGRALRGRPELFGAEARIGRLFDFWRNCTGLSARLMLCTLLDAFAPIWPGMGDVWPHPLIGGDGMVPLHKLSQWLCYSLIEVMEDAGVRVSGIEVLTGLAEYRNGGLFNDFGVLCLRDPALARSALAVGHPAIVEWRALTVALLDRLAPLVRARLGRSEAELPLASILQGGTWAAGRQIARARRADGSPPIAVLSDGRVF